MSQKASSSTADRKMEKSIGVNTQPCLTLFVTLNDSETFPPTLTLAIIPVCRASIIVVNFSGQPYFLSSCHSPVLPTVSIALLKSTHTMYSGRFCSMHFSCSCWRKQNPIYVLAVLHTTCCRVAYSSSCVEFFFSFHWATALSISCSNLPLWLMVVSFAVFRLVGLLDPCLLCYCRFLKATFDLGIW